MNVSAEGNVSTEGAQSGWQATLSLKYKTMGVRTLLSHEHKGPLRVQRPFFPEGSVNHTYLLHPPGGLVGNDVLEISTEIEDGAHVLITTPGATKAYRNICDASQIKQAFVVDGVLEWLPQEIILFDGSKLSSRTTFNLTANAKLFAWEIQCFGRPVGEMPYTYGHASFNTAITVDGKPALNERLVLAADQPVMTAPWGLNGAQALGTMVVYPADINLRDAARAVFATQGAAATLLDDLLVIRAMGNQAQDIRRIFIEVWRVLRPLLLGRAACAPRIWAT